MKILLHFTKFCGIIFSVVRLLPGKDVNRVKKALCFVLCACLLAGLLCCPVSAVEAEMSLTEQVMVEAKASYRRSLYTVS